jgi:hypothetical protein
MMPGVGCNLYAGVAKGGVTASLVANLGLDAAYWATDDGAGPGLACSMTFTVKRDGSWTMTIGGDDNFTLGTTFSGFWTDTPSATVGDAFEVQFISSNLVGGPTVTNETAGTFLAITEDRTFVVGSTGASTDSADMTANFRPTGGSTGLTDTTTMQVTGL